MIWPLSRKIQYFLLGKNVSTVDDIDQILDADGNAFPNLEGREKHITGFYRHLYSKRIDRLIEIESFFSPIELERIQGMGQKLPENIKDSLEGEISAEKLEKSLKKSNLNSCRGGMGYLTNC